MTFTTMKKIFLALALGGATLWTLESCSPKTTASTTQTSSVKRGHVSGNWALNDIAFEGIPESAVRSFLGENSYKCFIGSTWALTNSGKGSYNLSPGTECGGRVQGIFWSVSPAEDTFQFKKVDDGEKAKNVTDGYRLVLSSADRQSLVLRSPVAYGNQTAHIVLRFSKITE